MCSYPEKIFSVVSLTVFSKKIPKKSALFRVHKVRTCLNDTDKMYSMYINIICVKKGTSIFYSIRIKAHSTNTNTRPIPKTNTIFIPTIQDARSYYEVEYCSPGVILYSYLQRAH